MPCPKCSGCIVTYHGEDYCLNCGWRPVVAQPARFHVTELQCLNCKRDAERGSAYCAYCQKTMWRWNLKQKERWHEGSAT